MDSWDALRNECAIVQGAWTVWTSALDTADGDQGDYLRSVPYFCHDSRQRIGGALGSFWGTEASDPAAGSPVQVGPVSATSPEIEFDADGLTQVRAMTVSGNAYTFAAAREQLQP